MEWRLQPGLEEPRIVILAGEETDRLRRLAEELEKLDLSLTGTIRMTLEGRAVSYVSRRYVKRIKQALGL